MGWGCDITLSGGRVGVGDLVRKQRSEYMDQARLSIKAIMATHRMRHCIGSFWPGSSPRWLRSLLSCRGERLTYTLAKTFGALPFASLLRYLMRVLTSPSEMRSYVGLYSRSNPMASLSFRGTVSPTVLGSGFQMFFSNRTISPHGSCTGDSPVYAETLTSGHFLRLMVFFSCRYRIGVSSLCANGKLYEAVAIRCTYFSYAD